jgi:hypothetical protein
MRSVGLGDDLDQQVHYVCALCYPLVANSKSLQDVYKDSYLARAAVARSLRSVPDEVRTRLRDIVRSRDRLGVQEEFDRVLGRFEPPARVLPLLQEAFRRWVGTGVSRLRRHGHGGLERFLAEVDGWLRTYRRKGGQVWVRHFINLFAYQCKVCFYTCFANAWVDLIPTLRERGLDAASERFLRFWHMQSPPIAVPHGRTPGGVYYPTHGRVTLTEPGPGGHGRHPSFAWRAEQIGPTHYRPALNGQVLSLHPLSAFFMTDPALCAIAGRYFGSGACGQGLGDDKTQSSTAYWDLVGAILSAAHHYRQALDEQRQRRGVRERSSDGLDARAAGPVNQSQAGLLEEFAAARGIRCPLCGDALCLRRYEAAGAGAEHCVAIFTCPVSGHESRHVIARADLERHLLSAS